MLVYQTLQIGHHPRPNLVIVQPDFTVRKSIKPTRGKKHKKKTFHKNANGSEK